MDTKVMSQFEVMDEDMLTAIEGGWGYVWRCSDGYVSAKQFSDSLHKRMQITMQHFTEEFVESIMFKNLKTFVAGMKTAGYECLLKDGGHL